MPFNSPTWQVSTTDGRNFVLMEPIVYTALDGEVYVIPAGATSDGASTPPGLWPTIPPFGLYWPAAFLHDYLYRCTDATKARCDDILREAMAALGVPAMLARLIFEGVHLCGESSFDGDHAHRIAIVSELTPVVSNP